MSSTVEEKTKEENPRGPVFRVGVACSASCWCCSHK